MALLRKRVHRAAPRTAAARRRVTGERGSTLLEAAIVAPIFFALLFATIEGGVAFYERLSVANMSLTGARAASGLGNDLSADYQVLQAIRSGAGGLATSQIDSIVVYKAAAPGDTVPVGCVVASVSGRCNRYTGTDLASDATQFGCAGPPGPTVKLDSSWCPTTRKTALSGIGGPPDYIGVYVQASHRNLTGILGPNITLRSDTVVRMEPRTLT